MTESKNINLGIKISREEEETLIKKSGEYGISNGEKNSGKSALGALYFRIGGIIFLKFEEQMLDIGNCTPQQALLKISRNMNLGSIGLAWTITNAVKPAIQKYSIDEIIVKSLINLVEKNKGEKND